MYRRVYTFADMFIPVQTPGLYMYIFLGFIHMQILAFSLPGKVYICTSLLTILPTGGVSTFIDSGHRQSDFLPAAQRLDHTEAPKLEAVDARCRWPVSPEDGLREVFYRFCRCSSCQ